MHPQRERAPATSVAYIQRCDLPSPVPSRLPPRASSCPRVPVPAVARTNVFKSQAHETRTNNRPRAARAHRCIRLYRAPHLAPAHVRLLGLKKKRPTHCVNIPAQNRSLLIWKTCQKQTRECAPLYDVLFRPTPHRCWLDPGNQLENPGKNKEPCAFPPHATQVDPKR